MRLALLNQPLATALFGDCHKLIFVLFLAVVAQLQEVFSFFQFQFLFKVQRIKYTISNSLQEMPQNYDCKQRQKSVGIDTYIPRVARSLASAQHLGDFSCFEHRYVVWLSWLYQVGVTFSHYVRLH